MQTTPSLLNPSNYITYQALKRQEHEICVAIEIYLAEKCARIHYADLMDNLPSHLASKDSLLAWLNDKVVKGQLVRKGIISLYKQERPEDFEDGMWKPINFPLFVKYAAEKLTDKNFVNSRKLAEIYKRSFNEAVWLGKAATVMGLKLLEELHKHGQLRSVTAKAILDMNERSRELLEKNARVISRAARNNDFSVQYMRDIQRNFEEFYKQQWQKELQRHSQHEEYRFLQMYKPDIEQALTMIPAHIQEPVKFLPEVEGIAQ